LSLKLFSVPEKVFREREKGRKGEREKGRKGEREKG
jgi:hypothetical protein